MIDIPKQWVYVPLGTIAEFKNGINYNKKNFGTGIKVINVRDFQDYSIATFEELDEINPQGLNIEKFLLTNNDIIFVRSNGNRELIGRSLFVKDIKQPVTHSAFSIRVRFTSEKVVPRFYAYLFRTSLIRKTLSAHGNGTNISNLNQTILSNLEVPLPKVETQNKIVSILSTYDDLIENNTRRIEILEEMARMLYREWFLKFRYPGHESDRLVESELGLIPEGWEVVKLGKIASFTTGKLNSNAANPEGIYPFFTCSKEIFKTDTYSFDTECVLLAGNNANGIFHIHYFKGKFDVYQRTYVIRTLSEKEVTNKVLFFIIRDKVEHLKSISTGAATKFLTLTILKNLLVVLPDSRLQTFFSNCINPLFKEIELLKIKNNNLRQTRDLLLPRLISGEIDVENLNIQTE